MPISRGAVTGQEFRGCRQAAVVYNPTKLAQARLQRIVAEHEAICGWAATRWYETGSEDGGRSAAARAAAARPDVIIVVGGDGTVRAVADILHGTDIPIAIVPTGTGNLLARALHTPLGDIDGCISTAFTGTDRRVDAGVADFEDATGVRRSHVFMVMAGIGLDAEMAERTSTIAKRHLGWFAYVPPIARSIIVNRLFHLDYRVDNERFRSTRAHTVIVGNCGTLTGNLLLLPTAIIDDGLLDVVLMRPKGPFGWATIGTRLTMQGIARRSKRARGVLRRARDVHALAYLQGSRFEVRFDTPHAIQLDGDSFGRVTRAGVDVYPGAIIVRVAEKPGGPPDRPIGGSLHSAHEVPAAP